LFAANLAGGQAAFMARSLVLNFADKFSATITTAAWRKQTELDDSGGKRPNHQP
jgi:hypothetical protein